MNETQDFYKKFENKKIHILTKNNLHYNTSNLKISTSSAYFTDKYNNEILLALSEIMKIEVAHE